MSSKAYKDYICNDILGHISGIHSRAMFGGYGIYREGLIFAIIVTNQLYFKVDDTNKGDYEQLESQPFTYHGKGKPIQMSYWEVPESVMEDPEKVEEWMTVSLAISEKKKG